MREEINMLVTGIQPDLVRVASVWWVLVMVEEIALEAAVLVRPVEGNATTASCLGPVMYL